MHDQKPQLKAMIYFNSTIDIKLNYLTFQLTYTCLRQSTYVHLRSLCIHLSTIENRQSRSHTKTDYNTEGKRRDALVGQPERTPLSLEPKRSNGFEKTNIDGNQAVYNLSSTPTPIPSIGYLVFTKKAFLAPGLGSFPIAFFLSSLSPGLSFLNPFTLLA